MKKTITFVMALLLKESHSEISKIDVTLKLIFFENKLLKI